MTQIFSMFPFIFSRLDFEVAQISTRNFSSCLQTFTKTWLQFRRVKNNNPQPMAVHQRAREVFNTASPKLQNGNFCGFWAAVLKRIPCPCNIPASQFIVAVNICFSKQFRSGGEAMAWESTWVFSCLSPCSAAHHQRDPFSVLCPVSFRLFLFARDTRTLSFAVYAALCTVRTRFIYSI